MKKILFLLFITFVSISQVLAIEEVLLDTSATLENITKETANQEKTLREKLADIYYLEVEQTDKVNFLMKDILTKKYSETSFMDSIQFWGAYVGHTNLNFDEGKSFGTNYIYDAINVGLDGKLKDNVADFRIMLNSSPLSEFNTAQTMFADMYVATSSIPNHRVMVGNTRPPVGMEGGYSPFLLPFAVRSQIARSFGTVRKLGARVSGDYSLVDYDLGAYSSDTYFRSFFPGSEFVGWVNLKPLGLTDGRYGNLKIGGGMQAGHRNDSYCVTGAYIGYEYKKWLINFERAMANGYNGASGHMVDKKAGGFYSTLAYKFTPKLQGLIRYDEFDPNREVAKNKKREYSLGLNYYLKGQGLKLILNYVFCQNDAVKDSHRVVLGTQILL